MLFDSVPFIYSPTVSTALNLSKIHCDDCCCFLACITSRKRFWHSLDLRLTPQGVPEPQIWNSCIIQSEVYVASWLKLLFLFSTIKSM